MSSSQPSLPAVSPSSFSSNDEQATFLSLAAHELKTPLTSIQAAFELQQRFLLQTLGSEFKNFDEYQRMVSIGLESSRRLAQMIDDLLTFSRFANGKLAVHPQRTDLSEVVKASVNEKLAILQLQNRRELICDVPDRLEGEWDPIRMRQVVDNLISNAIKYSPLHGCVEVVLRREEREAVLLVKDDGIGIAPEDQHRIFEPYQRAVKSSKYGGAGIGLYVAARIIELHRGRIEVESKLGRGSCFRVSLPL